MTDSNRDQIWEVTIPLRPGTYHNFAFVLGDDHDWQGKENLQGGSCAVGEWNDRAVNVGTTAMAVGPLCFGKCCACDSLDSFKPVVFPPSPPGPGGFASTVSSDSSETSEVTFVVDMSLEPASSVADAIYIAGGEYFGDAGTSNSVKLTKLSSSDTVYTATVTLTAGEKYHFTVTNGIGPSGSPMEPREDIQNQDCADATSNFERVVEVPTDAGTTVAVCFGGCQACSNMMDAVKVTFLVDTAGTSVSRSGMFLAGGGFFGMPGDNLMTQVGESDIWQIVMNVPAWTHHRYFFSNGDSLSFGGKEDLTDQPCATGDDIEREFEARDTAMTVGPFCLGKCCDCKSADGKMVQMTVKLAVINQVIAEDGLYLAGGTFGLPGNPDQRFSDDGTGADESAHDGIYTLVLSVPANSHHYYTFTNGGNPDYSGKENIEGKTCAFGTFSDRYIANTGENDFTVEHCFSHCARCSPKEASSAVVDMTFEVDMSRETVSDQGVYLAGGRFGKPGKNDAFKMKVKSGMVYTITVPVPAGGLYNFKFANGACDDYSCAEPLTEDLACVQTVHADRAVTVGDDAFKVGAVCFGECGSQCTVPPSGTSSVTFQVKVVSAELSDQGVFLAGGTAFGVPGENKMTLNSKSGFHEITMGNLPVGSALHYSFTNGACTNWQCKESLGGKLCAAPWHYEDRTVLVTERDTTLPPVAFGHCDLFVAPKVDVTFYVELSQGVYNTVGGQQVISPHDVHEQGVYLAGGGTFGVPGDHMMFETSAGSKAYSVTMQLERGSTHNFAFVLGDDAENWQGKEALDGHACSFGEWNDRQLTVGTDNTVVGPFCFGQCCSCEHREVDTVSVDFSVDMGGMTVAPDGVFLAGGAFFGEMKDEYKMSDGDGDGVYEITVDMPAGEFFFKSFFYHFFSSP